LKLRDRNRTPWILLLSPIFESAFTRRGNNNPRCHDLLDSFEWLVRRDPWACGDVHEAFPAKNILIWESPSLIFYPKIFILYEINSKTGQVIAWNFRLG
jgi:hypothetical protein